MKRIFLIALSLSFMSQKLLALNVPQNIKWQTASNIPIIASNQAQQGGTLYDYLQSFPLTLRDVGPDSNGSFRSYLDANKMSLVSMHPNTEAYIPSLATHWAIDNNRKTVYFKLDKNAKWSDGKPVRASDYTYTREFMTSKHIIAPWYNDYFSKQIESIDVTTLPDGTEVVAVTLPIAKPDIIYHANITPTPRHFYGVLDKNFIKKFNWKIAPTTGPYEITEVRKGKKITFKKVKNWWAKDQLWFKNRFNINKIIFKVIRDNNVAFEYLKKGKIDYMTINFPDYWHDKTKVVEFENGYIHKLQAYNDKPRSDYLMIMNNDKTLFKDKNVRTGFQYSMNVDKVIDQVLRGDYERLEGTTRGYGKYTNKNVKARKFDLAKAKDYFAKAGWIKRNGDGILTKDGNTLTATVTYGSANMTPRLVVLREEAKKAGIDLKLKLLDSASSFKSFLEKKHEIAYMAWSTGFRPTYWGRFSSDNAHKTQTNNLSNTDDIELSAWINQYRNGTDEKQRINLSHKIQQRIHDLASLVPLFKVPYFRVGYWGYIKFPKTPTTKTSSGIEYFGLGSGGLIWIDKDEKKKLKRDARKKVKLKPVTIIDKTWKS